MEWSVTMNDRLDEVEKSAKQALFLSKVLLVGVLISLIINVLHAEYIGTINDFVDKDADEIFRLREQIYKQQQRIKVLEG